jgi:glycosyltransferase involved in cell wall biosynthesis
LHSALIIPAHNEEPVIGQTLDAVPQGLFTTVIVADNGSSDRTAEVAARHGAAVVQISETGYGHACLAAIAVLPSEIEIVVFMQADLSEDPRDAASLIAPIEDGRADMVLGSRVLGRPEPGALLLHQRFGNWLSTTLIRWLFGRTFTDLGPFRAITREALLSLDMREKRYGWTVEMQVRAVQAGLRILEVPVPYKPRRAGTNKVSGNVKASFLAGARILWTVLRLRATRSGRQR